MAKIYTRQEVKRRRINYKIFAGIYDFLGAVVMDDEHCQVVALLGTTGKMVK